MGKKRFLNKAKQLINRVKFVKFNDFIQVFPMILGFIVSPFFKIRHKNIWLVCERFDEARDNGYWFFKYLCEEHPEIESVYAIDRKCSDYNKVKQYKTIQYGSLKHWIYYFAARKNISSQKGGKPNATICFVLEILFGFQHNRYFLQHGITKDNARWLYYDLCKFSMFACAAEREKLFIEEKFGYPEGSIVLTGFCRYDNLLRCRPAKKKILVMPTHRKWLWDISSDTLLFEKSKDFTDSEYYSVYNSLLNNPRLISMLEESDIELVFYPHANMQKYADRFTSGSDRIIIATTEKYDVQKLMMESSLMVTDYSSVYFDFAYMKRPIIYYQFDYKKYREGQWAEGYFSYENDGFGKIVDTEQDLIEEISKVIRKDFKMEEIYEKRVDAFFTLRDDRNCERTYQAIQSL